MAPDLQSIMMPGVFMDGVQLNETTRLLREWAAGDQDALHRLTPRVYRELRRVAGKFMKSERPGQTIQATALVHEAFVKMIELNGVNWQDRAHFFAVAGQMMRRILLDAARKRGAAKRGGNSPRVNLNDAPHAGSGTDRQLIALDDALSRLAEMDPRKGRVVELRFFGGLSVEETAAVLNVSQDTILRDWRLARAWLQAELGA